MSIQAKENELFERWQSNREDYEGFVKDGVVNETCYLKSSLKIMFILKEANDIDKGYWDLREYISKGANPKTWNNITRWVWGIQSINKSIDWKSIKHITEKQRKDYLRSICAVNLKKAPGGNTTDNLILSRIAKEDKEYLNEQFNIYNNPDLVVCCSSIVSILFLDLIDFPNKPIKKMTSRGISYYEYKKNKYIIDYYHPQARFAGNFIYYGLVDAVQEILNNT